MRAVSPRFALARGAMLLLVVTGCDELLNLEKPLSTDRGQIAQCDPDAGCCPSCGAAKCGGDGCGGSCGECDDGESCTADGRCACVPQCGEKKCGGDGCGGTCGECEGGEV